MTTDITTTTGGVPAEWQSKLELVKSMVAKGCSQDEFELLCHLAERFHLDPLAREIWAIRYGQNPAQIFVGHAGLINLALRSGQLDGLKCEIIENGDDPIARATVWRKDMAHPIEAEVYWSEYGKDAKNPLWRTKPRTMLRKTAEVHALRRAFALSGLYTEEEMDHVPTQAPALREVPDTSRSVPRINSGGGYNPPAKPSTIAEPAKGMTPVMPTSAEPAVPIETCDVCGRDTGTYPALRVRNRDGRNICDSCHRKAEKAQAESIARPSPPESAPAAEIGSEYVCTECGRQVTASERKTSLLYYSRVLCGKCIQALDKVEPSEARA